MSDKFSLVSFPARRLITVRSSGGLWGIDDVAALQRALTREMVQTRNKPLGLLLEVSELGAQLREVVPLFDSLADHLAGHGIRYLAISGASALLGMQVKRSSGPLAPHFFPSTTEGYEWLDGMIGPRLS